MDVDLNNVDWSELGVIFKVWCIPQIDIKLNFEVQVPTPKEGEQSLIVFADYCNAKGLVCNHSYLTEGGYYDSPKEEFERQ